MAEVSEYLNAEINKAMQCVVKVEYEYINAENGQAFNMHGFGMFINERHVLTCRHVVANALEKKCIVKTYTGYVLEGTVRHLNYSTVDLALIDLPENYEGILNAPLLVANFIKNTDLCECYVIKYDSSGLSKGSIYLSLEPENSEWLILSNRDVDHGSSGSPIMDVHGRVRGILVGGDPRTGEFLEQSKGTDLPATVYGLASETIIKTLNKNGIMHQVSILTNSNTVTDATVIVSFTLPTESWKEEYADCGSAEYVHLSKTLKQAILSISTTVPK
jgi:hypothetical protein